MSDIERVRKAFEAQLAEMSGHDLFVIDMTPEEVWNLFTAHLPESPEIGAEVYEYTRSIALKVGNVMSIQDGNPNCIWDLEDVPQPFFYAAAMVFNEVMVRELKDRFTQPLVEA